MPMDFPDSLLADTAELHKFREQREDESIDEFRTALANHVQPIDLIESMEIRTSKGWDRFSQAENIDMITRSSKQN